MNDIISDVLSQIAVQDGVFRPDPGSIALAEAAMQLQGDFLEVGTGSGFISIVLALQGKRVAACDVSASAVACAQKNAAHAGLHIPVSVSNLFSTVQGKFDVIIFNPPTNAEETDADRLRKNRIKEAIPRFVWKPLSVVFQAMNAASRRGFLKSFIAHAQPYLQPGGTLLLNVVEPDWNFFQKLGNAELHVSKVNQSPGCIVVKLTRHR